jgi:hypothetical protein
MQLVRFTRATSHLQIFLKLYFEVRIQEYGYDNYVIK